MNEDKELKELEKKRKKHGNKCKGKFGFCWPWYEFSNGELGFSNKHPKGLGFLRYSNIKTGKKTRDVPIVCYGHKSSDTVALNYCPFCGADYEEIGRI